VCHCLTFTRSKIFKTVCQGIIANESIFAIIMKISTSIDKPKNILNKHSHLTDWSRMTSATSPHLFIEGNQRDLDFIDKGLRENEYAMFLRKVSSTFPDDILRNLLYNTSNDCLKEEDIFKGKELKEALPNGKRLVISSLFFLVPSIYAGTQHVYSLSLLSAVTTAVSVNYWRNPCVGWRRNTDLVFAKISFCIYFGYGLYNVKNMILCENAIMLYLSAVMIIIFYSISNYLWSNKITYWLYAQMIFHIFVAFGQFTVIAGIK
jgi:hypothetical protein